MEVALFSYRRGDSILHRVNAGVKIILLTVFCLTVFWGAAPQTVSEALTRPLIIRTSVCLALSVVCFILAGANWKGLAKLKFVLFPGLLVIAVKIPAWSDNKFYFSTDGLAYGIVYTLRFFITSFMAQTVFETTSSVQIKEALHLPLVITLAINFIPEIFSAWSQIKNAARARNGNKKKGFVRRIQIAYFELETLFSILLKKAEETRKAVLNRS